jgi:hypothetical protein
MVGDYRRRKRTAMRSRRRTTTLSMVRASYFGRRGVTVIALLGCMFAATSCAGSDARSASRHISMVASKEQVAFVPLLRTGESGWCAEELRKGGCEVPAPTPMIVEGWGSSEGNEYGKFRAASEATAVVESSVAAVAVERLRLVSSHPVRIARERWWALGELRTQQEPGLPDGLRAVVADVHGIAIPSRRHKDMLLRFIPLSTSGKPIPELRTHPALSVGLPVESVSNAAHPSSGVCRIVMAPIRGVFAFGAKVIKKAVAVHGLIGNAFTTCATTIYKFGGWRVEAAVLLDAAHPGARPADLPLMKALPDDHSGIVEAWPAATGGTTLARRIPGGWLVVEGGRDAAERRLLINHLHATIYLGRGSRSKWRNRVRGI